MTPHAAQPEPDDEAAFLDEVRAFLDTHLSADLREAGRRCAGIYCDRPVAQRWLAILNQRGWAVPHWPVEWGGTGWSLRRRWLFARELALADAPPITPNATHMVAPVLFAFGREDQKRFYLPRIRSGEDWWAQGYSEPGAGSDLASLKCRAVRDGEGWVLNGSKLWTTHAQFSNRIFCLVRTSTQGRPQEGISFLLFDMDLPGISVRPIITLSGEHEVNEVFFEDVRVPASALLGEENRGWTVAKYLLEHERSTSYGPMLGVRLRRMLERAARLPGDDGRPLAADPVMAGRLAEAGARLEVLDAAEARMLAAAEAGLPVGALSSMMKVQGTELRQHLTELAIEIEARHTTPFQDAAREAGSNTAPDAPIEGLIAMATYLNDRAASIYAGSNEIQRTILAGRVLGL